MRTASESKMITMAMTNQWGRLTPAHQSTYAAAVILTNIFESLVQFDPQGNLQPSLALSWEITPDMKQFHFKLDTSRRFSNGEFVSAQIVKKSFEQSLRVAPESANQSALDLLYKVVGYADFQRTGTLSGVIAESPNDLVINFTESFRRALTLLAGVRYSSYIIDAAGNYLGTGPYQIIAEANGEVTLKANPYAKVAPPFSLAKIVRVAPDHWKESMCNFDYDVYWLISPQKLPECLNDNKVNLIPESGFVTSHLTVNVNAKEGRIFSDPHLRRAIQYLLATRAGPLLRASVDEKRVEIDPQFLMPLQLGRLSDEEANGLIEEGARWVPDLIQRSKTHPIRFVLSGPRDEPIQKMLQNLGVQFIAENGFLTDKEFFDTYYKTLDFDLLLWTASMGGLDPDALYHYLGKSGAITSPAIGRPPVWTLLEEGRAAIDNAQVSAIYQKASRAILETVPSVHLGFYRSGFLYKATVAPRYQSINSNRFNLSHIMPAQ